jgi:adenylate cyclase
LSSVPPVNAQTGDLGRWLALTAGDHHDIAELHQVFCDHLFDLGLPIWRCSLGVEVLHPETSGAQYRWVAKRTAISEMTRPRGAWGATYDNSPVKIVDETDRPFRRRIAGDVSDMPLLVELQDLGATDYFIVPLPFLDTTRSAHMSFATQRAEGFSDSELASLEDAARLFGPYAERVVLQRIAIDLLRVYIGRRSGERVYRGAVVRGEAERITAAILMADMRGFTRFSESQDINTVLATLDDFFSAFVEAIEREGGEVLKFMGDALLAIFPETDGHLTMPARAAVAAAQEAHEAIAALNQTRAGKGMPAIDFGLALHAGEVAYGNIGGRSRLDFTVIGPAVNFTSRMLERTRTAGRVLISETFAIASQLAFFDLGAQRLRDIEGEHRMFTIHDPQGNG